MGCIGTDSDGDGFINSKDAFPNDAKYHLDSDEDGYADAIDAFPDDAKYHLDSDKDGYADAIDAFPNYAKYHLDSDKDGYADAIDAFPDDAKYHLDSDGDGYADEVDAYPDDAKYHLGSDKIVSYEFPPIFCDSSATTLQQEIYFDTNLKDKYVTWIGEVSSVSSSGDDFNLHVTHCGLFSDVLVEVRSDQFNKVINLKEGDTVTYTAKLWRYGSFLGFYAEDGTIN